MIRFLHPEALLLALLPLAMLRRGFLGTWPVTVLRALLCVLLAAVVAQPYVLGGVPGRDLIVVVDRSRSVPLGASSTIEEVSDRVAKEATADDRVGVVSFGRTAAVETAPTPGWSRSTLVGSIDPDGTDLGLAIDTALALVPPDRPGSILLVSDGEGTGADAEPAARRALRRGVSLDVVPLRRGGTSDLAVEEVSVPSEVAAGEPFQFSAWVRSDRPGEGAWRLLRDGVVQAEGRRSFRAGLERLTFRDRVGEAGVHVYGVEVSVAGDRVPENDRARAVVRVGSASRVLCVTPGGRADRLTRSLAAAGLDVVVAAPERAPADLDGLDGVRAVVLEDVPASDLPTGALDALSRWVVHLGGGLLMTGGGASFGPGGYHESSLADVLPVSLEMREEQRKFSIAMALVLDRSGSMAVPVAGGMRKMDLANLGACAAVDLLTAMDSVSVVAVDSEPHLVVPLQPVKDRAAITSRVRAIESMGGGIFVATGLHAGAGELRGAKQGTRHIVLFSDANDAEEPGDYETFVPELRAGGITVSVIGLGTDHDSGAEFLKDVAAKGGGRCFFTADPADLPRVFAQETIQVAKSALVEEPCAVAVLPDLVAVGALASTAFPDVGGYTIAYRKPEASAGLVTKDEQHAPLLSFWQRGLGRSAAFLGQADGKVSGGLATWKGYGDFFATLVRWTAGSEASGAVFAEAVRRGHEGVLTIETEAGDEAALARIEASLVTPAGRDEAPRPAPRRALAARGPVRARRGRHAPARGVARRRPVPPRAAADAPVLARVRAPHAPERGRGDARAARRAHGGPRRPEGGDAVRRAPRGAGRALARVGRRGGRARDLPRRGPRAAHAVGARPRAGRRLGSHAAPEPRAQDPGARRIRGAEGDGRDARTAADRARGADEAPGLAAARPARAAGRDRVDPRPREPTPRPVSASPRRRHFFGVSFSSAAFAAFLTPPSGSLSTNARRRGSASRIR